MARNTREWALRKLDSAKGALETMQMHCVEVLAVYKEAHPKIADHLDTCAAGAEVLIQAIDSLKQEM